jgi:hypothetical protein
MLIATAAAQDAIQGARLPCLIFIVARLRFAGARV